jgi:hypothetical protein
MTSALPPILVEIQADVASLKKGLADATNTLKGLDDTVGQSSSKMSVFMDKIKQVGATLGVAFAGTQVIQFFKESIAEANAASAAQERLAKLLENTNGGTREQVAALIEQAEALEAVGVVSKDNIITAQSQLATFDLTAGTIKTLTPAIIDYVTAEKGAAASADDFRSMTNGLAQALQGNFASLTKTGFVLDEATKKLISSGTESERAAAVVDVLNSTYAGFNETLRDNNPLQAAINDLGKLKGDIGEALLPAVDKISKYISNEFIPALRKMAKWFNESKDALKVFTIIVGGAFTAFKLYKGILVTVKVATQLYTVATTLMSGGQLASIASTNGLAASMLKLNAAMRANPLGLIITAIALIAAGFVYAWKRSETFREIVIKVAQVVMNGFAKLAEIAGKFFSLLGKVPGMGWAKSVGNGLDSISDKVKIASKNLMDLKSGVKGMGNISMTADGKTGDPFAGDTRGNKGGGLGDKEKKKLTDYKKKVKDIYEDMNSVIQDANERAAEALESRNERMADAQERYNERVVELNERYNERLAENNERYGERVADIKERYNEQMAEAQKRYDEAEKTARKRNTDELIKIAKDYSEKIKDLETKLQEKLSDLQAKALDKRADLTQKATEKQASIVKQSIDRLTSAFASATSISLTGKGGGLLASIRKQLEDARKLQEAAGYLAGQGYSQTFIEQVLKAGPEAGLALVKEIKGASPEQQSEIKTTFKALEAISDTGMDALAESMNKGANLATSELRRAYDQVAEDLKASLSEVDKELKENMASAQASFNSAMAEAASLRDTRIAESHQVLQESLAEATKTLQEAQAKAKAEHDKALAEAYAQLVKANEQAKKELDKGLKEAQETLQKALIEAQKAYEKAIDKINEATQKKLEELKKKLAEVAQLMAALGAAQAAAAAMARAPVYTPIVASGGGGGGSGGITSVGSTTNVTITGVNLTSPSDTATAVLNSIKYGNAVVPTSPTKLAAKESGAIGAASIKAQAPKLDQAYISMRAR